MNTTLNYQQVQRCRDGHDCPLQHDSSDMHNSRYSHPCRWSELCRNMNRNSEHARLCTHDPHSAPLCRYSAGGCTKLASAEHRRDYRHDGLPDFLLPCKFKDQCRDSSTEHRHKFAHPSNFQQQTSSMISDPARSTTLSALNKKACRYGSDCRNQSDPNHRSRFSHPTTSLSTQKPPTTTNNYNAQIPGDPATAFATLMRPDSSRNVTSRILSGSSRNVTSRIPTDPTGDFISRVPRSQASTGFHACGTDNDMEHAYRIGGALARDTLSISDQQAIQNMPADAIVVVPGDYDHIDRVLNTLSIKFITVERHELLAYPFRTDQTVYINCSRHFPQDAARHLRQEVEKGLHLLTTDWALRHVLEVAFSDFVKFNGRPTADEVVGIQVVDPQHSLVSGFLPASKHAEPQWWLESGSHPIEIVNRDKVRVLIRSDALGRRYRSDAVLVTFDCGRGNVIHMISHFYLQRSETRNDRHQMSAKQYAMDINASPASTNLVANQGQNLNYAQIQSSSTSAQFIYNQITTRLNSKK